MGLGAVADFCPENPDARASGYFLMSSVQNRLPSSLGSAHTGAAGGKVSPIPASLGGTGERRLQPQNPLICLCGADGGLAGSASRTGEARVPLADVPGSGGLEGRQVKPVITGKQPWACADRPPRAQAGGLLTREGPRVWTLGTESHRGGWRRGGYVTMTPWPLRK